LSDLGAESSPQIEFPTDGVARLQADADVSKGLIAERNAVYEHLKDLKPIPELEYKPKATFKESSAKAVLYPLIKRANCLIVAGGFFGDEGKGKTVDAIATHPDVKVVARVNSGENAGHTVFGSDGTKYAFNLCPSGLLTPGKINLIGPECVMDPVSFMEKEISQLIRTGVTYKDMLFVGNVHLVCPHHKLLDLMNSWKNPNMSTIMGMAPVHASKAKRKGLRMDHLFNDRAEAISRLKADLVEYHGAMMQLGITAQELYDKAKDNKKVQPWVLDFICAEDKCAYVMDLYDKHVVQNDAFPSRTDVSHMLRQTIKDGGKVLLEGPQSYWLSNAAEKFWDSGTSANTCAAGMLAASRLSLNGLRTCIINIHKTPGSSRVGSGANPVAFVPSDFFSNTNTTKSDFDAMLLDWDDVSKTFFDSIHANGVVEPKLYSNSTGTYDLGVSMAAATCIHPAHGEFGVTSGRPRVVGFFDCVVHAECMAAQGPYCSISAFDRGDAYDAYGVCIAYVFLHPEGKRMTSNGRTFENGTIIKAGEQLPNQAILRYCHPLIKKVEGWKDTPLYAGSDWWKSRKAPVDLPKAVSEMLDIIEHFTGARVISIGNGPKGEEIIYIKRKAQPEETSDKKPSVKPVRKRDPADGNLYTLSEIMSYYKGKYRKDEIRQYFDITCTPVRTRTRTRKGR